MRKIQLSSLKFVIIAYLFLLAINAFGEASLLSIKKGSKGDKSWAVLYFNEPAPWIGISQREAGLLSLYFIGDADKIDKSSKEITERPLVSHSDQCRKFE